jgi:hypothetical protein
LIFQVISSVEYSAYTEASMLSNSQDSTHCMEPEFSLPYSQEPATYAYPGLDELIVVLNIFYTLFHMWMCLYILIVFLNSYIVFFILIEYVYLAPLVIFVFPSLCGHGFFY